SASTALLFSLLYCFSLFFFKVPATTELYTLSLHDALPISALADLPRRAGAAAAGLRLDAAFRGRPRSLAHAPADGRDAGGLRAGHPADPGGGADQRQGRSGALADARPAQPQGLDRSPRGRRPQGRGLLALAPGATLGPARQSRPHEAAGGVAAQLPARGAVRHDGPSDPRAPRARSQGRAPHGRQSARQRRSTAPAAAHAGLPQLRDQG